MSNNILIFRTDRIGDLIYTCPSIMTIKNSIVNQNITLVCSDKNYEYAKNLNIFNEIIIFPTKGILSKLKCINALRKRFFDYIFIFDGKERSIIASGLIKANYKVSLAHKKRIYYKIPNIKFFHDNDKKNLNATFQEMLTYCKINTQIKNYDFINKKLDNKFSSKIPIKNYVHIHLDEKWVNSLYIKTYTDICPNYDEFIDFLNILSEKNHILITTGLHDFELINELKNRFFENKSHNIFFKSNFEKLIYFIHKPTFDDIESLLRNTRILISCHGAITHASNSFNIKKIDILEYVKLSFYKKFTAYLDDYYPIYRSNFFLLRQEINKKIQLFD